MGQYQFDHEWQLERARLASLEQFEDPHTISQLEAIGVGEGWRCLEVGAGGGSIAAWLCERVGPRGHVLAVDLETKFLQALDYPNLEVRRLDVTSDPLPEAAFDLIHERAVLIHLQRPEEAIARFVRALKPGGWLLCEDTDFVTVTHAAPAPEVREAFSAVVAFLATIGADINFGRRLFGALEAAGLDDVQADGAVYTMRGGHPSAVLPKYTLERVRTPVLAGGAVSEADYDAAIALFDDPSFSMMSPLMVAGRGRRPE
jgi:SAM-dependent methyltransferase